MAIYFINESDINSYYNQRCQILTEKHHEPKPLKSSFRTCVNTDNGHMMKVVFDLDPKDVKQVGDHTRQDGRNFSKDRKTAENIRKNGCNDFSSTGRVKAIVDMDTGEKLKSVKAVGIIGNDGTRFQVPEDKQDKYLGRNSTFDNSKKSIREDIVKNSNAKNASDAITFTVGEKEHIPTYKSTTATNSTSTLYYNQYKPGRGKGKPERDQHINTYISKAEKEYNTLKSKLNKYSSNPDIKSDIEYADRYISKLKRRAADNAEEKFAQTPKDSRYSTLTGCVSDSLADLRYDLNKIEKDNKKD